ncbi:BQ2448_890 [Microbotryum intermedium]|uniref:BQ2448_890 protein n=1 Tax=Microbotryum intermedium TaxID=269621 RepID=A0A238F7N6_9BASI|nr:BQ2448_890 [Microbotryum intermedium]
MPVTTKMLASLTPASPCPLSTRRWGFVVAAVPVATDDRLDLDHDRDLDRCASPLLSPTPHESYHWLDSSPTCSGCVLPSSDPFQDDRSLREALDNVVTIVAVPDRPTPRSTTNDSLLEHYTYLSEYSDSVSDRSASTSPSRRHSPIKTRPHQFPQGAASSSMTFTRSAGPFADGTSTSGSSSNDHSGRSRAQSDASYNPVTTPNHSTTSAYKSSTRAPAPRTVRTSITSTNLQSAGSHPNLSTHANVSTRGPTSPNANLNAKSNAHSDASGKLSGNGNSNAKGVSGAQMTRHASLMNKKTPRPAERKSDVPLDVIDKLDISGLYGGGGLVRHDGPYAAATAARNKGPCAPVGAFTPAALIPPFGDTVSSKPKLKVDPPTAPVRHQPSARLSPRAAAALNAMEQDGLGPQGGIGKDGPYAAAGSAEPDARPKINMGFPIAPGAGKGSQLIEMYGVRDSEAWEDFGRRDWTAGGGTASTRGDLSLTKEERFGRTQSIWDIEATLAAGKPVGVPSNPPPMPALDASYAAHASNHSPTDRPKRTKSLARRFGRSNREGAASPREEHRSGVVLQARDENVGAVRPALMSAHTTAGDERIKDWYDGGQPLRGVKSAGQDPDSSVEEKEGLKRPNVMQRLFLGRKKA